MNKYGRKGSKTQVSLGTKLLFAIIPLVLIIFTRAVPEAFDLPKAVLVVSFAPVLVAFTFLRNGHSLLVLKTKGVLFGALIFASCLVVSAIRNPSGQLGWTGQEHRFTGAIFWLASMMIASVAYTANESNRVELLSKSVVVGSVPFLLYGVLQMHGWDPYVWNTETFDGNYIFATQGNPNFASWTTALCFGCGLVLFFSRRRTIWSMTGLTVAVVAMVISVRTISIQGIVGISLLLVVWAIAQVVKSLSTAEWSGLFILLVLMICLAVVYLYRANSVIWIYGLATLLLCWFVSGREVSIPRKRLVGFLSFLFALAVIGVTTNFSRIQDWISEQSGERRAFYRAAFGMIGDQPLFGHGFDRYGRLFTRYRPTWHAEQLPNSISGSAHSIWLGLMVSGGLLLVVPMLTAVVVAIHCSWRWAKKRNWDPESVGFFGLVIVLPVIWFFSVEQASVILVTLVVLALAMGLDKDVSRSRSSSFARFSAVGVCALLLVLACAVSYRWLAGNKAQSDAYRELFAAGNIQSGLDLLDKAADWGPQSSEVRAIRANIYSELGVADVAVSDALWVAREYEYSGYGSLESAVILIKFGEEAGAIEVLEGTIANNSNNQTLVDRATELLTAVSTSGS